MTEAFRIAGVGLAEQQAALDAIANNIANINTPAFKRTDVSFSEIMTVEGAGASGEPPRMATAGVAMRGRYAVDENGPLQQTGHALDVAIDGAGFIELLGPGGESYLWRGGRLTIADDGLLASDHGYPLRAGISAPRDAVAIAIAADGSVQATESDGETTTALGQILLAAPENVAALERVQGGLYRVIEGARQSDAVPGEDGAGLLVQGAVERSNVELTTEMVALLVVQRAFAANAQVAQAADEAMAIANNLRR